MLLIDRREEHSDLVTKLRRFGCDAEYVHLDDGDCCFEGNGIDEEGNHRRVMVGIERKRLSDLVNCMNDNRLTGKQLRGMKVLYDHRFLFIEADFKCGLTGAVEVLKRDRKGFKWNWDTYIHINQPVMYRRIMSFLTTLELIGYVVVRRTKNVDETASQYAALWHWFNSKKWAEHSSLDQIYTITPGESDAGRRGRRAMLPVDRKITRLEMIAAQLPGVDSKARDVAKHFGTVRAMASATEKDWLAIKGVGKVTAKEAVRVMTEAGV